MSQIAEKSGDLAAVSGDLVLMGDVLIETGGSPEKALAKYAEAVKVIERADVEDEVKEATRRNQLYYEALVALRKGDLATATKKAETYRPQAHKNGVALEVQQAHELAGKIALAKGDVAAAIRELEQSNQQDPRILWELSRTYEKKGDRERASAMAEKAASFNQLNFAYAYVRNEARESLTGS